MAEARSTSVEPVKVDVVRYLGEWEPKGVAKYKPSDVSAAMFETAVKQLFIAICKNPAGGRRRQGQARFAAILDAARPPASSWQLSPEILASRQARQPSTTAAFDAK